MSETGVYDHVNLEIHKESIENIGKNKIKKQLDYILLGVMWIIHMFWVLIPYQCFVNTSHFVTFLCALLCFFSNINVLSF